MPDWSPRAVTRDPIPAAPNAGAMIEALRDIGYSLEAAVADIIDNSITAKANTIDIRFGWQHESPWLAIVDDGTAMNRDQMLEAMRPGSRNPLDSRTRDDLGRFGLGLKTASFSQSRRLTVVSRRDADLSAMRWDLDDVKRLNQWSLFEVDDADVAQMPAIELLATQGTLVLWQKLDRLDLSAPGVRAHAEFNERIAVVRKHLELVFHRYLTGDASRKAVVIRINGDELTPFDPFNEKNLATNALSEERISLNGEDVVMQPFILPHHSKVSPEEYERLSGLEGYLRSQGFYVYRNRRLIVYGTWFRIARQEELTKLARVRVDIPNTLDHLWTIDVRKSRAQPPISVKQRMRQIVEKIRTGAKRPYTRRGTLIAERDTSAVWERRAFNDRIRYEIRMQHPIVNELLLDVDESLRHRIQCILKMIAVAFPAPVFFSDYASNPKAIEQVEPDQALLAELARMIVEFNPGIESVELRKLLSSQEPFASWPSSLDKVVSQVMN